MIFLIITSVFEEIPLNIFKNHRILFIKTQVIVLIDIMKGVFGFFPLWPLSQYLTADCGWYRLQHALGYCNHSLLTSVLCLPAHSLKPMQDIFSDLDHERVANRPFMYIFFRFQKKNSCLSLRWWNKVCFYFPLPPLSDTEAEPWIHRYTIDRQYLFFVYLPHKNQRCTQKLLCNVYTNGRPPTLSWSRSEKISPRWCQSRNFAKK